MYLEAIRTKEEYTDKMYCECIYRIEYQDTGREEVVALYTSPSYSFNPYAESQKQDDYSDAVQCPRLAEELRHSVSTAADFDQESIAGYPPRVTLR